MSKILDTLQKKYNLSKLAAESIFEDLQQYHKKEEIEKLNNSLIKILEISSQENIEPEIKQKLLDSICGLSPKRTGLYLESLCRKKNNFTKSTSIYSDALTSNDEKVEIKSSRVLKNEDSIQHDTLYEQLIGNTRVLASVQDCFISDYDCNIQQVKTSEFAELRYCLFFREAILEFKMTDAFINDLKTHAQSPLSILIIEHFSDLKRYFNVTFNQLDKKDQKDNEEIIANIFSELDYMISEISYKPEIIKESLSQLDISEEIIEVLQNSCFNKKIENKLYIKNSIAYSDKQHKGNVGEGQFHIKPSNILFHLINNLENVYSYNDFIDVLKEQYIKPSGQIIKNKIIT